MLSAEEITKLRQEHYNGASKGELARKYNFNPMTVRKYLNGSVVKCGLCGEDFIPVKGGKFCSSKCKNAFYNRGHKADKPKPRKRKAKVEPLHVMQQRLREQGMDYRDLQTAETFRMIEGLR